VAKNLASHELLADKYALHQAVMSGFSGQDWQRVLFRVERPNADGSVVILVQSMTEPRWKGLPMSCECKPFERRPAAGGLYSFRIRANTASRLLENTGHRISTCSNEASQMDWLRDKGGQHGFSLVADCQVANEGVTKIYNPKKHMIMSFQSALFQGILRCDDAAALRAAAEAGIGRGRGFGFGLLSLATKEGQ
jgi:CRISPR system Cascade subunit CasE